MEPRRIPVFATEAEEAKWWFDNREELADDFVEARTAGRVGETSKARFLRKQAEAEQQQIAAEDPRQHSRAS